METFHDDGTPLATYLEGEGYLNRIPAEAYEENAAGHDDDNDETPIASFAPSNNVRPHLRMRKSVAATLRQLSKKQGVVGRIHNAWSTALNSRLGRADNARFLEHFRYVIVASQLLNEYLDQGALPPSNPCHGLDGAAEGSNSGRSMSTMNLYGAAATAAVAFALVYMIHWARSGRDGAVSKGRVAFVLVLFVVTAFVGYGYVRRQWLKFLRRNAVAEVTALTANWQVFEVSASSALSLIQEVELVSKGYRLSTPLPPASRLEDLPPARRCSRLRKSLSRAYLTIISTCIQTCNTLRALIDIDDLERYFEVYDINSQDAREAAGPDALSVLEDDSESLKSLRVLSYRTGVLRRVMLCSLMALEADGGKPDFLRWRLANDAMSRESTAVGQYAEKLQQCLTDMETTLPTPITPSSRSSPNFPPARDKMRTQVRKISLLSSGIRALQAKMQILREETNRSIEASEDLSDLAPNLMAQYESIGSDLKDLMAAWEAGKASLQHNITKQERRISHASSSLRSPVSSIGGLTAVEEGGTPADALKALTGDTLSNRSSMGTVPSDEELVFEAVALPRQRSTLTREERIVKMQEERERQASVRAARDANTGMLRELQTVLSQRPPGKSMTGMNDRMRITSI